MNARREVSILDKAHLIGAPDFPFPMGEWMGEVNLLPNNRTALLESINSILGLMMERQAGSGSFVTAEKRHPMVMQSLSSLVNFEVDGRGGSKVEPWVTSMFTRYKDGFGSVATTMRNIYAGGGYRLRDLTKWGYFGLKYVLGIGQNIDLHAYDKSRDVVRSNQDLQVLLRLALLEGGDDFRGYIAQLNHYGRFLTNWVVDGRDKDSGGYYVMLLSKEHQERYITMLNYRRDQQTGKLTWTPEKGMAVEVEDLPRADMEMVGEPQDLGEWLMNTARAIRMMVMEGSFGVEQINIESFLRKTPKDKSIGYEAAMGMMQNLMVAAENNPGMVTQLMDKLGLHKYCYYQTHPRERGQAERELRQQMEGVEAELMGEYVGEEDDGRLHFRDMVDKMLRYSPVSVRQLHKLIPKPEDREVVKPMYVGSWSEMEQMDERAWVKVKQGGREFYMKKMYLEAMMIYDKKIVEARQLGLDERTIRLLNQGREVVYELAIGRAEKTSRVEKSIIRDMNHQMWCVRNGVETYPVD